MPVVSASGPCVVAFVVVRAGIQAPLATISYELGAHGARAAGVAIGTVMGLLNVVWAAGATAAPLLGGAVVAGAGASWVFVLLALACAAAGLALRLESAASAGESCLPTKQQRGFHTRGPHSAAVRNETGFPAGMVMAERNRRLRCLQ